jgi:CheY-like chemotaxis protein
MDKKNCSCEPRILVVDDNQFNIMVIKNMIDEYFGLEVEEASNGEIAT